MIFWLILKFLFFKPRLLVKERCRQGSARPITEVKKMADWEEKRCKMVNARIKLERTAEVIQQMIHDAYELEKKRAPAK